jgi:hypothetical protein
MASDVTIEQTTHNKTTDQERIGRMAFMVVELPQRHAAKVLDIWREKGLYAPAERSTLPPCERHPAEAISLGFNAATLATNTRRALGDGE